MQHFGIRHTSSSDQPTSWKESTLALPTSRSMTTLLQPTFKSTAVEDQSTSMSTISPGTMQDYYETFGSSDDDPMTDSTSGAVYFNMFSSGGSDAEDPLSSL